mgnify:CR=1 FL=1
MLRIIISMSILYLLHGDNTNLRNIKVNDFVNVEIDLLSRYLVNYQKRKDN